MNVEIAERLASRRKDAGYSQESLAEQLGVTRQAVSKWERSESSPDTDNLIALAKLYGVSLDELLNVDPSIADDVAFEAADRASAYRGKQTNQQQGGQQQNAAYEPGTSTSYAASNNPNDPGSKADENTTFVDDDGSRANIDSNGATFVDEKKNYVHINWRDGVHVKDAETGEEVHVGWKGIHINDGSGAAAWSSSDSNDWWSANCSDKDWTGDTHIFDKDSWRHKGRKASTWFKFPIYVFAILAYLLVGFFASPLQTVVGSISPWAYGTFLIAIIPIYYMIAHAVVHRGFLRFIQGFYPFACLVFFLWMWLIMGIAHPTWVVFLTVPIIEWICQAIRKSRRRKATADAKVQPTENDSAQSQTAQPPSN